MAIPNKFDKLGNLNPLKKPLTLIAEAANSTVKLTCLSETEGNSLPENYQIKSVVSGLQYKTSKSNGWVNYSLNDTITLLDVNDYVQFRNKANKLSDHFNTDHIRFQMTGKINASGNLMSMLNYSNTATNSCFYALFKDCTALLTPPDLRAENCEYDCYDKLFKGCTSLTAVPRLDAKTFTNSGTYQFKQMFFGCTSLTSIPQNYLPITNISPGCYYEMFRECTNIINTCNLPALTAKTVCYYAMFYGCTKLSSIPSSLPATNLATNCYQYMFYGCTSLTSVNVNFLPASILPQGCYAEMFQNCSNLTNMPNLQNATTLKSDGNAQCYLMFYGCTSLTTVYRLPATTLRSDCYRGMFYNCSNLTTVPSDMLPATILDNACYYTMFCNCNKLTNVPALPATKMGEGCYREMFSGCSSLTSVPFNLLPATTLTVRCYRGMFYNCSNLTNAPYLPAETLTAGCYYCMFTNCTNLNTESYAIYLPADELRSYCYYQMFYRNKSYKINCWF